MHRIGMLTDGADGAVRCDRFGAKASKAASAQSRQKQLDKMELIEAPQALRERKAKLQLPEGAKTMHEVIRLDKASFGWEADRPIFEDVNVIIERGMRLVIVGPNGAGKSTLLWALAAKLPLTSGKRRETEALQMGVFTQDLAQVCGLAFSGIPASHEISSFPGIPASHAWERGLLKPCPRTCTGAAA